MSLINQSTETLNQCAQPDQEVWCKELRQKQQHLDEVNIEKMGLHLVLYKCTHTPAQFDLHLVYLLVATTEQLCSTGTHVFCDDCQSRKRKCDNTF